MLRELLRTRQDERDKLLQRVRLVAERDARVRAAWLFGSSARGDADALSDLDVAVVVRDDEMRAVAGGPEERPVSNRRVRDSLRGRWVAQVAEPLLLLEAPQNAVPGGAFVSSFHAGQAGSQEIDWHWEPLSTARLTAESLLLFDRDVIPREAGEPKVRSYGPVPDRTPFEVAARRCRGSGPRCSGTPSTPVAPLATRAC
ncbi:nucleotidyltransferase domain-containing protein [Flindersiella endophytica]